MPGPVLIGTPAYGSMVHIDYVKSLIEFINQGTNYTMLAMGNESLISRARNNILSMFYHSKGYDKLLFIDADIYLPGTAFRDIMSALDSGKFDVVGAGVRLKSHNVIYNFNPGEDHAPVTDESGRYMQCKFLGTAVFGMTRKAVNVLVDDAKKHGRVYDKKSVLGGGDFLDCPEYYDVFRVGVPEEAQIKYLETGDKGLYLSEDYYACTTLNKSGIPVWVDLQARTLHHGTLSFDNAQPPQQAPQPIVQTVV